MTRKKNPPIKIDSDIIPVVTANPTTIVDGALKLAAVASTIMVVKVFLDAVSNDAMIEWTKAHPAFVPAAAATQWFGLGPAGIIAAGAAAEIGDQIQYIKDNGLGAYIKAVLENLGFREQQAQAQVATLEQEIANTDAAIVNFTTKVNNLQNQLQVDQQYWELSGPHTEPERVEYERKRKLDQDELASYQGMLASALLFKEKEKQEMSLQKAMANVTTLTAERARWLSAIVVGSFLATTMIYAGDSVLDLAAGALSSLGLIPKVA